MHLSHAVPLSRRECEQSQPWIFLVCDAFSQCGCSCPDISVVPYMRALHCWCLLHKMLLHSLTVMKTMTMHSAKRLMILEENRRRRKILSPHSNKQIKRMTIFFHIFYFFLFSFSFFSNLHFFIVASSVFFPYLFQSFFIFLLFFVGAADRLPYKIHECNDLIRNKIGMLDRCALA